MNYWIIGHGGIGKALVELLEQQGHGVMVVTGRDQVNSLCHSQLDLTSQGDIERFVEEQPVLPDRIINTVGMLHDSDYQPEKNLKQFSAGQFSRSIEINTMPTFYLANALSKRMDRQTAVAFITLSARVGSISDNQLGGWYSYRMSKCALNMLIKNISIEWKRRFPLSMIFGYHPGTVDTGLSKPFLKNVPNERLFSTEMAAKYCLKCIDRRKIDETGLLFDWQGEIIKF